MSIGTLPLRIFETSRFFPHIFLDECSIMNTRVLLCPFSGARVCPPGPIRRCVGVVVMGPTLDDSRTGL